MSNSACWMSVEAYRCDWVSSARSIVGAYSIQPRSKCSSRHPHPTPPTLLRISERGFVQFITDRFAVWACTSKSGELGSNLNSPFDQMSPHKAPTFPSSPVGEEEQLNSKQPIGETLLGYCVFLDYWPHSPRRFKIFCKLRVWTLMCQNWVN